MLQTQAEAVVVQGAKKGGITVRHLHPEVTSAHVCGSYIRGVGRKLHKCVARHRGSAQASEVMAGSRQGQKSAVVTTRKGVLSAGAAVRSQRPDAMAKRSVT